MSNKLLKALKDLKEWINENPQIVKRTNDDGRIDSLLGESAIIENLKNNFDFIEVKSGNRDFGDLYINIDKESFPVNIKLTSKYNNSNDNLVGIVSLMNYIFFDNSVARNHAGIARGVASGNFSEKERDYGFISITKETGEAEVSTMITMEGYVVNPSNGFQANFNNIRTVEKTFEEGRALMLEKYKEYLKKKAEPYLILEGLLWRKEDSFLLRA